MESFFLFAFFVSSLFLGGENRLSGYVNPEHYWEEREVAMEVNALSAFLEEEKAAVQPEDLKKWVAQLGADSFKQREEAGRFLSDAGAPAEPLLLEASRSRDPEVSQRAKRILETLNILPEEAYPMDSRMAVYGLSMLKDPAARTLLEELAGRPSGELQKLAQELLSAPGPASVRSPGAEEVLRFPPDIQLAVQAVPMKQNAELLRAIHQSLPIQQQLVSILQLTGDLRVHRVTGAVRDLNFSRRSGEIILRLEMDYDPRRFSNMLEKSGFRKIDGGPVPVFETSDLKMYLVDASNLVLTLSAHQSRKFNERDALSLCTAANPSGIPQSLSKAFSGLPEDSLIRGAGTFTGADLEGPWPFAGLRSTEFHISSGLPATLVMTMIGEESESAEALRTGLQEAQRELLESLGRERQPWAAPMKTVAESLKLESPEESRLLVKAAVSRDQLLGMVSLLEQACGELNAVREREERRREILLRHQQILINRGGPDPFGFH